MTDCRSQHRTTSRRLAGGLLCFSLLSAACYLPRSDVERTISEQVLVAVYRCSASITGGEISNDSDVDLVVTILPRWLDATRTPFHEVEIDPITVPAKSFADWETTAGAEIDDPQFCEAETVSVEESQ